ncbi:MAG: NAD(P)/FAD-dependent oxidoreductase [Bacteroidota bacterium]|nr:NAD(P)/FAD-dependent oxidoreductase [Bacteroidota bacterium]
MEHITLIGGGLSGSLLSVYMARRGFKVDLFERRPDMRSNKISAGRSINLALSNRGINALNKVGLTEDILSDAIPMHGRMMHSRTGELNFQPYGTAGQCIYSVSRGRLNTRLLELADEYENINLHFDAKCTDINIQKATATFEMADGTEQTFAANHIIGTDGAFAATRGRLQVTDRFDYSQSYLHVGYKELCIPPGPNGEFKMEKNALHIWPRGAFMMIALPNPDGTFTCTLFLSIEGIVSFNNLKTEEDIIHFFEKEFPDALTLMPTLAEDFFANPTGSLVTVKCWPWAVDDKVALLGDAAHAVVPFFGQGMNCSFEDCVVMDECIEKYLPDWSMVFDEYQQLRKPNADAIASLAVQNFYEMSDKVGDAEFLHRKHIEHDLCDLYPDIFQSQYELVTFSQIPYLQAQQRGPINDQILSYIIDQKLEDQIKNRSIIEPVIRKFANYL